MGSVFDYELEDDVVPGYRVIADLGGSEFYRLQKVCASDNSFKLWKRIDLSVAGSAIQLNLLDLLKQLDHPGLCRITHIYRIDRGQGLILQTEFPALTLKDRLQECVKPLAARGVPVRGVGIPTDELLRYMGQLADALDFLNKPQHEHDGEKIAILHRALRPECMVLFDNPEGRVCKISEYGLFGVAKSTTGMETTKHVHGFAQQEFSPPEFSNGQTALTSDQFSLAGAYYYLRTNELPYSGSLLQVMQAQINDNPNLELVPLAEANVIRRALLHDPQRRYPRCKAFVEQLQSVVPRQAGSAGPVGGKVPSITGSISRMEPAAGGKTPASVPPRRDDAAPRLAAIFYRRGAGLSKAEIQLPPEPKATDAAAPAVVAKEPSPVTPRPEVSKTAPRESSPGGSSGRHPTLDAMLKRRAAEAEAAKEESPAKVSAVAATSAAAEPAGSEHSGELAPAEVATPAAKAELAEAASPAKSNAQAVADTGGNPRPDSSASVLLPGRGGPAVAVAARISGEKPKVYMPRSRAEVVLPPLSSPPASVEPESRTVTPPGEGVPAPDAPGLGGVPLSSPSVPTPWTSAQKTPVLPRRPAHPATPTAESAPQRPAPRAVPVANHSYPWAGPGASEPRPCTEPASATMAPPWAAQTPASTPQQPPPPWTYGAQPTAPPWAGQVAPYPEAGTAPSINFGQTFWTWIQLILLVLAGCFLGYVMLFKR